MPNVVILGSTGSIGRAALDVIEALGGGFRIVALAARESVELLADQVRRFSPACVSVSTDAARRRLLELTGPIPGTDVLVDAAAELARLPEADIVLSAMVGAVGLEPAIAAVTAGKRLALANKEALVMAGHLVTQAAAAHGAELLPVDSEHSAVFQALHAGRHEEVDHIVLTASGGPFYRLAADRLAGVTPEQALAHPTWQMGPKVTIDSATLMNKALEIIEARWLFDLRADQIEVVVHPQSIVHSVVAFVDGSSIAQLGVPDMQTPIQYALTYPGRQRGLSAMLDLAAAASLTFERPDMDRFPALRLGFHVAATGGTSGAVLNASNEVAVAAFREGRLRFDQIVNVVQRTLDRHTVTAGPDLAAVLDADAWARKVAQECLMCQM
ncbi:MAG TPA: 1-deoxy-D-xylulose-5-phosphate reductoisomerase [Phycisphaerae bacterium]|nr:1-deoxy-D-xylulose-5-phosphate reductoisomerase [Phycisphaerae bacterium]HOI55006.1 1-deoxy-D-xylulose-5-phosphate reductoisomerase [Phycisphaerae bacterium]